MWTCAARGSVVCLALLGPSALLAVAATAFDSSVKTVKGNLVQITKSGTYEVASGDSIELICAAPTAFTPDVFSLTVTGESLKAEAIFSLQVKPPPTSSATSYVGTLSTIAKGTSTVRLTFSKGESGNTCAYTITVK
jgi:hypothetical protein